jgi:arginyl-tRNA synthetase
MNIQQLKHWIRETLEIESDFVLEYPTDQSHGDYSTNIALVNSRKLNINPRLLAEQYVEKLKQNIFKGEVIKDISIAGPGFINFFLHPQYFGSFVAESLSDEKYGTSESRAGQKIIIEYTDPNPFKEFHIGHLMSNTIGESISRIIGAMGAEVKRACYQGDVGLHVATAVWGMMQLKYDPAIANAKDLGHAYAYGAQALRDNPKAREEITDINKKIFSREDEEINAIYDGGRKTSLEYFETIYKKLGTHFDYYFFESETGPFGKQVVEEHLGNVFEKSEGAVIFPGEKYDPRLHTRVFINKDGLPTYEAKELGLSKIKHDAYPYTTSIVITGNEVNDYFKVLLMAMSLVFPEFAEKTKHLSHGMLRLPEGKMSSRTGNVITAVSLIDEVEQAIIEKMTDREISLEEKKEIAEIIAIGALKYSILRQSIGKDIVFDFETSVSFEGDSGPYLQYATVRAKSILHKAGDIVVSTEVPSSWQTTSLERMIERYPHVVARAGEEYAPHYIVTYLVELAGAFNAFYASTKIIDSSDITSPYKLALTQSFANIMTSGLNLLGINVPDSM